MAKQKRPTIKTVTETVETWKNLVLPTAESFNDTPESEMVLLGTIKTTTSYEYTDEDENGEGEEGEAA